MNPDPISAYRSACDFLSLEHQKGGYSKDTAVGDAEV